MKIDLSRDTFDRDLRYTRVLMQQGRVQLDADWNEQVDILWDQLRQLASDLGGRGWGQGTSLRVAVGAKATDGFPLTVKPGRFYLCGMPCLVADADPLADEAKTTMFVSDSTVTHGATKTSWPTNVQGALVMLHVRETLYTCLDDPNIREIALGGPDTAARAKIESWLEIKPAPPQITKDTAIYYKIDYAAVERILNARQSQQPPGRLQVRIHPDTATRDACSGATNSTAAGYRGPQNQIYRVEVRKAGSATDALFSAARDNGSVAAHWDKTEGQTVTIDGPGIEEFTTTVAGDWVELTDAPRERDGTPGDFFEVAAIAGNIITLKLTGGAAIPNPAEQKRPRVRRWNSPGLAAIRKTSTAEDQQWISIGDGIEVRFEADAFYRAGDYWLIPARTTGELLGWSGDPRPPQRPFACAMPLAYVEKPTGTDPPRVVDLRRSMPTPSLNWVPLPPDPSPVLTGPASKVYLKLIGVGTHNYEYIASGWRSRTVSVNLFDENGAFIGVHTIIKKPSVPADPNHDLLMWSTDEGSSVNAERGATGEFPNGDEVESATYQSHFNTPQTFGVFSGVTAVVRRAALSPPIPTGTATGTPPPVTVEFMATYYFYRP